MSGRTASRRAQLLLLLLLLLVGGTLLARGPLLAATPAAAAAQPERRFPSQHGTLTVTELTRGLEHPWSLAFLPDGDMLVSERPGRLRLIGADGRPGAPLAGLPAVAAEGQGGLLDLALAPDYARSGRIYFSYSEPRGDKNGTAVAYARLDREQGRLRGFTRIFQQQPAVDSSAHFGSRLVFAPDGKLFVTLGERASEREQAQTLDNDLGKLVRLNADGTVPADNPFVHTPGARPEIWSYGHRNPQGAAINPASGELWIHEHGPKGGDELNLVR
ncbi:MAG: PQQ-dependent sugar dehydrogenase, partial [Stagnimonas sp.]|nr:PQQ-dependent sugar dehydrogenase [Stagnimonas sp.]